MKSFMKAMANVVDGSDRYALQSSATNGFDPEFVQVYRNNSMSAFHGALLSNYPSIASLVGPEYFSNLARNYAQNYPAMQRTLVGYGVDFPELLSDYQSEHHRPYFQDFARLDRAWTVAHLAADRPTLAMDFLTDIVETGGDLEAQKLALKPDVRLVENEWPVFEIWSKLRQDQLLTRKVELKPDIEHALVWRHENEVVYRVLRASEFAFLTSLRDGDNLGAAMSKALGAGPNDDIMTMLPTMVGAGLFRGEEYD